MSKIKFGTDGWRAIIAEEFTFYNLTRVAEGMAKWLQAKYPAPSVIIGYDCRFLGARFCDTVANVMAQNGIDVYLAPAFSSTPMVSLAVQKQQISAGVVITASHNPPDYSGFKIKGHFGGPATPEMITEVEALIPDVPGEYPDELAALREAGKVQLCDMEALYLNQVQQNFDLQAIRESGLKIGYDAMYGAGQSVIRKILPDAHLLHADFNPSFHGTAPEPIERNLGEFQELIRREGLDIGIATDGDADRIGMFDENGDFVDSHHLILLLLHYLHKVKGLSGKVITTFSVTPKVAKLAEQYGLPVATTKVGFKYICQIMLDGEGDVLVGGEESGGIAIAGHVPERDGIYIGLTIAEMMAKSGKKLTELVREIYDIVGAFSFQRNDLHISFAQKQDIIAKMQAGHFTEFGSYPVARVEDFDGFKFFLPDEQWVMIRPSGTEPVLRVYAESSTRAGAENILQETIATILHG
ncbi:MAG: phosphoglucomutase/phosphomannomutase family protein [Bacteroidota bacterium]